MHVRGRLGLAGRLAVLLLAGSAVLSGCQWSSLQFRADTRLTFTSPNARQKVGLPLTVTWSMKDFATTGLNGSTDSHHGTFAVFVDQRPMPPGKNLTWLGRNDSSCTANPRCPSPRYLAGLSVFVTTATSVTLHSLPPQSSGVGDEQHYVTIVLLDGTGRRISESNWYLPFKTARGVS